MTDEFEADRRAIYTYGGDVWAESLNWRDIGERIKNANIDPVAFTQSGGKIAKAYEGLVADYSWYAWRIGVTLDRVMKALDQTAQTYGKAEAKTKDDVNFIGKQF